VFAEQLGQQAVALATSRIASSYFATASWLSTAAASWGFAATSWLGTFACGADVTTSIAATVTENFSEQVARRSVHGAEGNESKGQQRRGNNTTHRGELQGLGFGLSRKGRDQAA